MRYTTRKELYREISIQLKELQRSGYKNAAEYKKKSGRPLGEHIFYFLGSEQITMEMLKDKFGNDIDNLNITVYRVERMV